VLCISSCFNCKALTARSPACIVTLALVEVHMPATADTSKDVKTNFRFWSLERHIPRQATVNVQRTCGVRQLRMSTR
jgi:hypothetical protein